MKADSIVLRITKLICNTFTHRRKLSLACIYVSVFIVGMYYYNRHQATHDHLTTSSLRKLLSGYSRSLGWQSPCGPKTKVVFLKTYKTASTTVSAILMRYGYYNNLSFALPLSSPVFSYVNRFNRKMKKTPPLLTNSSHKDNASYDILASHVPFDKSEIAAVIPAAIYVTILRYPVSQFESTFGFMRFGTRKPLVQDRGQQDALEVFLSNPSKYYEQERPYFRTLLKNRQIFDVGLDTPDMSNETKIQEVIQMAEEEFDLVMISEYFDESLILLKKLLCWSFEDILYLPQNKRQQNLKYELSDWKKERILEWNAADYELYNRMNATFWRKVKEYGPLFKYDLAKFRDMLAGVRAECLDEGHYKVTYRARRNDTMLKGNATQRCSFLNWDADVGTLVLRKRQNSSQHINL
ncbi:galactosylceramide sulfotransferase-like [Glandiceps talaboti]